MHRSEGIPKGGADSNSNEDPHKDTDDASDGKIDPHFEPIDLAEHDHGVDEHESVANHNLKCIKENSIRADVRETLDSVGEDLDSWY